MLDQNVKTFWSGDTSTNSICDPPFFAPDGCLCWVWRMEGQGNAWIPFSESGEIRWVTWEQVIGSCKGRPFVLAKSWQSAIAVVTVSRQFETSERCQSCQGDHACAWFGRAVFFTNRFWGSRFLSSSRIRTFQARARGEKSICLNCVRNNWWYID